VGDLLVAAEVFLLSLLPSFEGRYALVLGVFRGLNPILSMLAASAGVILLSMVLPHAFPKIDDLMVWMLRHGGRFRVKVASAYLKHVGRIRVKAKPYIGKYGIPGLIFFVALPLPSSGVWTGALIAYVLAMSRYKTMAVLLAGGLLSNFITLTFTLLGFGLPSPL